MPMDTDTDTDTDMWTLKKGDKLPMTCMTLATTTATIVHAPPLLKAKQLLGGGGR